MAIARTQPVLLPHLRHPTSALWADALWADALWADALRAGMVTHWHAVETPSL